MSPKYYSMWSESRCNKPFSNNPRNFVSYALKIVLLALLTSRLRWDPFLVVNCIRWVFQNLMKDLTPHHLLEYLNTVIMQLTKFVGLELVTIILVSANGIDLDIFLTKFGKPFI
jgi:hypothetical protein